MSATIVGLDERKEALKGFLLLPEGNGADSSPDVVR
jgi:hypothetical protein